MDKADGELHLRRRPAGRDIGRCTAAPALDLSGIARLPEPPRQQEANAQTPPSSSPGSASPEAAPAAHLKPSLTEVPFDPLTVGKRQDFLKDHLLGIKLQTPF